MLKARAIAAVPSNPLFAALDSIKNVGVALSQLLYGSKDRIHLTYAFALALLVLGYSLGSVDPAQFAVCIK